MEDLYQSAQPKILRALPMSYLHRKKQVAVVLPLHSSLIWVLYTYDIYLFKPHLCPSLPPAARLHHTYQSTQILVQMPYLRCKSDASSLGISGEIEAQDTWTNFFPSQGEAESWEYSSAHSAEQRGLSMASVSHSCCLYWTHYSPQSFWKDRSQSLGSLLRKARVLYRGTKPFPLLGGAERQGVSI